MMWLVTTLVAATAVTALWLAAPKRFRLGVLCLMLWGASAMIMTDHILGFEGGKFIHVTTEGMVTSGAMLGVTMLIPIFVAWEAYLFLSVKRGGA